MTCSPDMAKKGKHGPSGAQVSVVPVGPRFQAVLPKWENPDKEDPGQNDEGSSSSRWLGTRIWPVKDVLIVNNSRDTGEGRSDSCSCDDPGSSTCRRRHVAEERERLCSELGPAYESWKFDEMGEEVSRSWTKEQEKKFETIVMTNPPSRGKCFVKPAMESLSKSRAEVVTYFFNVFLPRKFSIVKMLDSDAELPVRAWRKGEGKISESKRSSFLAGKR